MKRLLAYLFIVLGLTVSIQTKSYAPTRVIDVKAKSYGVLFCANSYEKALAVSSEPYYYYKIKLPGAANYDDVKCNQANWEKNSKEISTEEYIYFSLVEALTPDGSLSVGDRTKVTPESLHKLFSLFRVYKDYGLDESLIAKVASTEEKFYVFKKALEKNGHKLNKALLGKKLTGQTQIAKAEPSQTQKVAKINLYNFCKTKGKKHADVLFFSIQLTSCPSHMYKYEDLKIFINEVLTKPLLNLQDDKIYPYSTNYDFKGNFEYVVKLFKLNNIDLAPLIVAMSENTIFSNTDIAYAKKYINYKDKTQIAKAEPSKTQKVAKKKELNDLDKIAALIDKAKEEGITNPTTLKTGTFSRKELIDGFCVEKSNVGKYIFVTPITKDTNCNNHYIDRVADTGLFEAVFNFNPARSLRLNQTFQIRTNAGEYFTKLTDKLILKGPKKLFIKKDSSISSLTLSEEDKLKAHIFSCWSIPLGLPYNEDLLVRIKLKLNPDGSIRKTEILDHARMNKPGQGFYKVLAESALRAIKRCQPLPVPIGDYERVKELQLNFDAREMLDNGFSSDTQIAKTETTVKPKKKVKVVKKEPKQEEFKPKKTNQDNEAPIIEIAEAITVDSQAYTLKGKVKDKSQIYLTINGRQVDVKKGKFELDRFSIDPDVAEELKIVAIDQWNNKSEKIVKVTIDLQSTDIAKVYEELKPNNVKVKTDKNKIAIIIGIEKYENLTNLDAKYANRDAKAFRAYATRALGIKPSNIKMLIDDKATRSQALKAFKLWLPKIAGKGGKDIHIFFAGHGLASDNGEDLYILPQDGESSLLEDTAISRVELISLINKVNPKSVTMFFDTCYSGQTRDERMLVASLRPIRIVADEQETPDNFTIFTASNYDQTSGSIEEAEHGMFSYYLMKGLEGKADENDDRKITNGELIAYLKDNVSQVAFTQNREQDPMLAGDPDKILMSYR